ncbi:MAG TPA: gamma-glutamyl-gamma-aminobutyrate hydrolase family protein [Gemmatimonadaceae bacterium]|nr:gamma-glutamyl-gamma-aminobutyrate hydrolase family protein [Gemmatimonadaceae bacterium]
MPRLQSPAPIVAVTATSEVIRDALRVRLNAAYVRALEGAGLVPLVVPPLLQPERAARLLERVDGLVLTGGEDVDPRRYGAAPHPECGPVQAERDATELALVAAAQARGTPTLAICRGIQLLNVALGGTLVQDLPSERGTGATHDPGGDRTARTHDVVVSAGSRLAAAVGRTGAMAVNSFHHQALDRVAAPLVVTACARDGVIEAAETPPGDRWWVLAVQWHPEELTGGAEEWDRGIFAAFAAVVSGKR